MKHKNYSEFHLNHFFSLDYLPHALIGLWAFSLFLAPTTFSTHGASPDSYKSFFLQIAFHLLWVFFLLFHFFHQKQKLTLSYTPILLIFASLILFSGLSIFWAHSSFLALQLWLKWLLAFVAFLLIIQLNTSKHISVFLLICFFSVTILAVIGIGQALNWTTLYLQAAPPAASFGNRNMAMHIMLLVLPFCLPLFQQFKRNFYLRNILSLSVAMIIGYILTSGNRTALIGLSLEILLAASLFLFSKRRLSSTWLKTLAITIGLTALLMLMLHILKVNTDSGAFSVNLNASTIKERFLLWKNTLPMIQDFFLKGVGLNNWTLHFPHYMGTYELMHKMDAFNPYASVMFAQTHNEIVQIFAELGIIGLSLFLALIIYWLRMLIQLMRHREENALIWTTFLISIAGFMAPISASFPLKFSSNLVLIGFLIGVTSVSYYQRYPNAWIYAQFNIQKTRFVQGLLAGLIFLILLSGFLLFNWHRVSLNAHIQRTKAVSIISSQFAPEYQAKAMNYGMQLIQESLKLNPNDPDDAFFILANMYRQRKQPMHAISTFKSTLNIYLYHPYAHRNLALTYMENRDYLSAIELLSHAIDVMPQQTIYHILLAKSFIQLNQPKKALEIYRDLIKNFPNHKNIVIFKNNMASLETQIKSQKNNDTLVP